MKDLFIYFFCVLLCFSCKTNTPKNESTNGTKQEKIEVKKISEKEYKDIIFDYETNTQNWEFKGSKPCIVDCYADWCRPCRMIAPYFDTLAQEYAGKVNFYKINIDEAQNLAAFFHIKSIPTVMCCDEEMMRYSSGAYPIEFYRQMIDSLLLNK